MAELFLSDTDPRPMYRQIVDEITARVMSGDWPAGMLIPSIRELAAANGVSVITVKRAYLELEQAGLTVTRHGKGSFVATPSAESRAQQDEELQRQIDALLATARRLGYAEADVLARVKAGMNQESPE